MDTSALTDEATAALDRCTFGADDDRLAEPPELNTVFTVNENRDGDPVLLPWIDVDLTTAADPDRAAAYRIAAEIVEAVHPAFRDEHVRQYDVVFEYGETSLLSWSGDKRLIAVRPRQAERLTREPEFDARALRDRLETLDDGDDEIPPVAWGEPAKEWEYRDDDLSWMFGMGGGI